MFPPNHREAAPQRSWIVETLRQRAAESPHGAMFREYRPERTDITVGEFYTAMRKIAHFLQSVGVRRDSVFIVDVDMAQHWEAYAAWCAGQMTGAVAFFWPPDMRFRFAQAETVASDAHNGGPTPVVCATTERAHKWIANDRAHGVPQRPLLCLGADGAAEGGIVPFGVWRGFPGVNVPAECGPTAAFAYTQGSHHDARRVPLAFAHLRAQAAELCGRFGLGPGLAVAVDLTSVHTVTLTVFAACVLSGAAFVCRSADVPMPDILRDADATHAFCLPTTVREIASHIESPASAPARRWHRLCLRLGKYRQRNPHAGIGRVIRSACTEPLRSRLFPSLRAIVSYGNHFHAKSAETLSYLQIPVYNAYTVAEFGFAHIHGFMGDGGFMASVLASVHGGLLSLCAPAASPEPCPMDDLVFEDGATGLCTHRTHLIALEGGRTVDVAPAREFLRRCPLVEDVFIFGEGRPFLTALVYPDAHAVAAWAARNRIEAPFEELTRDPRLYRAVLAAVEDSNLRRPAAQAVRKFAVLPRPIAEDPRILTPCLLTRIPDIERRYAALLDSFYRDSF